jgi:dTDP-4-dehydrorhamnose reductase
MAKAVILGVTGMLGRGVLQAFEGSGIELVGTARKGANKDGLGTLQVVDFDAMTDELGVLDSLVSRGDWVINCIGIIKPHIKDDNADQRQVAMIVNGIFPDKLARFAEARGLKVIQIATDCVYAGTTGRYSETAEFDALDVYGKTKSLGEVPSPAMMHLRVSIIGPEYGRSTSLLEWVRNQPQNAEIFGFTDHLWNGITTYHFGRLCRGVIETDEFFAGVTHVIPGSTLTKENLVKAIAKRAGRADIKVIPKASGKVIDRTLSTTKPEEVAKMWKNAGYSAAPSVEAMIEEMPL